MSKSLKILFLDIDGVLNHYWLEKEFVRFDGTIAPPNIPTPSLGFHNGMDSDKVAMLNEIMAAAPGWDIVISSAWHYDMETECRTQSFLRHFGFKYIDRIKGATAKGIPGRGQQILHWCESNEVEDFITIEDEPCDINGHMENVTDEMREIFKDRVFQPYCDIGLTAEIAKRVIARMTKK